MDQLVTVAALSRSKYDDEEEAEGVCVCGGGVFGETDGPSVPLKAAPAQLLAADAAVPGLFSVKQPGLLAFKPSPT